MKTNSHPDDEQHRLMTDGGIERAHRDTDEDEDLPVGARVTDRDATDPNVAVVVARPEEPAYAVHIDALDGSPSVADVNEDYPASCAVATVAYAGDLDAALDVWREAAPEALARICEDHDVRTYDFPTERLRPADEFSTAGEQGGEDE